MGKHDLLPRHSESGRITLKGNLFEEPKQEVPRGGDGDFATQYMPRVGLAEPEEPVWTEEHLSPDHSTGLGRAAVRMSLEGSLNTMKGREPSEEHKELHQAELAAARHALEALTPKQAGMVNELIKFDVPPPWLKNLIGKRKLVEGLTARSQSGEHTVSDATFQNFLEWHNYVLSEKQYELDQQIEGIKTRYERRMRYAVKVGWAPPEVLSRLDEVMQTPVIVDDGFATDIIEAHAVLKDGKEKVIKVAPTVMYNPAHSLTHEFGHVLGGRGLRRIFGEGEGGRAMDEAADEQFADSLERGALEKTNPRSDRRYHATYGDERLLLHTLLKAGVKKIDIQTVTWALLEGDQTNGEYATRLVSELHEAFPFTDVVAEIRSFQKGQDLNQYVWNLRKRARAYKRQRVFDRVARLGRRAA